MTTRQLSVKKIVNLASDPAGGTAGELYFNTVSNEYRYHNGTSWVDFGTAINNLENIDYIDFDTTANYAVSEGQIAWNAGEGTFDIGLAGGNVVISLGQEQVVRVKNNNAYNLTDGQVVYITGAAGQRPTVSLAQANSESTSAYVLGVVTEPILAGNEGFVTTFGVVNGVDTSAFTAGSAIWLSETTAGAFTATKPTAPNHLVQIGFVVKSHATSGQIFVRNQNGYELEELHDVSITSKQDKDALLYDSATSTWKNNGTYLLNTSSTAQTKNGNLTLNGVATAETFDLNEAQISANVKNINVVTPLLIDSFSYTSYRSAEYIVQLSQGSNFIISKILLIHNGTDVAITEYGQVSLGSLIPYDLNAYFSLDNLEITLTCSNANITPVDLKFSRVLFDL